MQYLPSGVRNSKGDGQGKCVKVLLFLMFVGSGR
jgi:hypothetical protein